MIVALLVLQKENKIFDIPPQKKYNWTHFARIFGVFFVAQFLLVFLSLVAALALADPDADASFGYRAPGYVRRPYFAYGLYDSGLRRFGHGYGFIGKRSADPDPQSDGDSDTDADPDSDPGR